jgi:hypothetical protein
MEQGANHMPEVPVKKAASSDRFLKWSGRPRLCPHDRLPIAVTWLENIHSGVPSREWLSPFICRITARRKGVGTPCTVSSRNCRYGNILPAEQGKLRRGIAVLGFGHSVLQMFKPATCLCYGSLASTVRGGCCCKLAHFCLELPCVQELLIPWTVLDFRCISGFSAL